jgi:hypothetical protein
MTAAVQALESVNEWRRKSVECDVRQSEAYRYEEIYLFFEADR